MGFVAVLLIDQGTAEDGSFHRRSFGRRVPDADAEVVGSVALSGFRLRDPGTTANSWN